MIVDQNMKGNKAFGINRILIELINHAREYVLLMLYEIYNDIHRTRNILL